MSLLTFVGLVVLTHGLDVAVVVAGLMVTALAVVIAVHVTRRPRSTPIPVRPAVGSAVVGRPIRTHRRRSGAIVRHDKTGARR